MKKRLALIAIAAVAAFTPAAVAAGTDTGSMAVTASVESSCTVDSVSAMGFAPYTGAAISATSTIQVTCVAADANATLSLDDGLNLAAGSPGTRQLKAPNGLGDQFLSYSLKVTNDSGSCWGGLSVCSTAHSESVDQDGTQKTFTAYGEIDAAQDLYVGSYSDSVVVTIAF